MNMKLKAMLLGLSIMTALPVCAQKPVYLDTNKPIEERVKDVLNRMTLEEKVKMIHAQSKFSSAGVPRLGIPEVWATDGPHGIRPEVYGMNGIRQDGQTILVLLIPHSHALPRHGIPKCPTFMEKVSVKKHATGRKTFC